MPEIKHLVNMRKCRDCNGTGKFGAKKRECRSCNGLGWVKRDR